MDLLARVRVENDRSNRHLQQNVFPFSSGFVRAFAMPSALRLVLRIESKMNQRVMTLARLHDDVAALTAISARRTAARNKLLPPESDAAISAVACFYANCGFINEHDGQLACPGLAQVTCVAQL